MKVFFVNYIMNYSLLPLLSTYKYRYLGSWITEDGKCEMDIKTKISMAKDAFWKHKELLRGNIYRRRNEC